MSAAPPPTRTEHPAPAVAATGGPFAWSGAFAAARAHRRRLLAVLAVLLFGAIFLRAYALHLDEGGSNRLRFHAIPVAIAVLAHGLPHDYTSRINIAHRFQNGSVPLRELIAQAADLEVSPADPVYLWAADDRGMADFVIASFALFGLEPSSLFLFFFVVLGVSATVFWFGLRAYPAAPAMLVLALTSIWVFLPVLALTAEGEPGFAGPGVPWTMRALLVEPRTLELLALLPVLHLGLWCLRTERATPIQMACLLVQALILLALYHARSSLGWMLLALAVFLILHGWIAWRRAAGAARAPWRQPELMILGLLAAGLAGLTAYKHAVYHPSYFAELGPRTFWHNALMGLGARPELATRYRLGISDNLIAQGVIDFGRQQPDVTLPADWSVENAMLSLGAHRHFDWTLYETMARRMYLGIWRRDTAQVLSAYFFTKPAHTLGLVVRSMLPSRQSAELEMFRKAYGLYWLPLGGFALFCVAVALALFHRHFRAAGRDEILLLATLFAASFIPSVAFYGNLMTTAGVFLCLSMLVYVLLPRLIGGIRAGLLRGAPSDA